MFTYDPEQSRSEDTVRFLVQDTDGDDPLVDDEAITLALSSAGGNKYRAASEIARSIALKLGRRPSVKLAIVGLDAKEQYDMYMGIARDMDSRASMSGGAGVFAGGISKTDMRSRQNDTDRPTSTFTTDLHST